MVAMRLAGWIEMPACAQAIAAGTIAFFMDMKPVLGTRLEAAHLARNMHHTIRRLFKTHCACDGTCARWLELGQGRRPG